MKAEIELFLLRATRGRNSQNWRSYSRNKTRVFWFLTVLKTQVQPLFGAKQSFSNFAPQTSLRNFLERLFKLLCCVSSALNSFSTPHKNKATRKTAQWAKVTFGCRMRQTNSYPGALFDHSECKYWKFGQQKNPNKSISQHFFVRHVWSPKTSKKGFK